MTCLKDNLEARVGVLEIKLTICQTMEGQLVFNSNNIWLGRTEFTNNTNAKEMNL